MQLDPRFQERIAIIVTVIVGILGAIILGKMTAQGQTGTIALLTLGAVGVASLIHFRERVWVLIPVCWPFYGSVSLLPVPLAVKDLGVAIAFGAIVICITLKIVRFKPRFTYLDALFYLNVVWLFSAFIRNPVGFYLSDSERVGGRPYVSAVFGFLAYWVLCRLKTETARMRRVPMYALGAIIVLVCLNVLIVFVPSLADYAAQIYNGFDFYYIDGTMMDNGTGAGGGRVALESDTARVEMFRDIGKYSAIFLCAYFYPPTLLNPVKWRRSIAFFATGLGLLLSGFRSFLVYAGGMFLLGSFFRKGWVSVIRSAASSIVMLFIVMLGHGTLYELPFAAQRALAVVPKSMRPVELSERAVADGESSTDWRVEMWILALTTDRYISDKLMGDGFGMDKQQQTAYQKAAVRGVSYEEAQEHMAIAGEFHSGPVSTVRVVGYIGLVFIYLLLLAMAYHAAKLIRRSKETPMFAPVLFFCMPIVFEPFWFTFVFGAYGMALPFLGFSLGMMKVIENSLNDLAATSHRMGNHFPAARELGIGA